MTASPPGARSALGQGPTLPSMEANACCGSTAVDFTVECEWLGRVDDGPSCIVGKWAAVGHFRTRPAEIAPGRLVDARAATTTDGLS